MTLPLLLLALAADFKATSDESRASRAVTTSVIGGHIRALASDAMEGRAPGSAGDAAAQKYIEQRFQQLGLEPGAPEGGWRQAVSLVGVTGAPERLQLRGAKDGKALELRLSQDFIAVAGHAAPETSLDGAELVFAGYGIVAPEFQWDDYKGADVRGKVLLIMN